MSQAFDQLETVKQVAARLNKHPRTIMRWTREPDGLPFLRLGQIPYIHLPSAQAWIERRILRPNPTHSARKRRPALDYPTEPVAA
jgi:hypothetical protein